MSLLGDVGGDKWKREVIRAKIRKERQIGRGFNHHVIEDDNDVWGTTSTK